MRRPDVTPSQRTAPHPVFMVLGLLCATIACGERVAVEHLDRASAEALAAELQSAGVAPELRRSGGRWAVVVPASAGPMAERITADLGLARPAAPTRPRLVVGPTEAAADARRHAARDAEALLRARPDVAHAAVSVGAESAAVVVRVRTGSRLTADDVRRLVGHATRLDSQIAVDIHASPSLAAVAGPADGHARRADRARWTVFGLALLMVSAMCLWLVGRLRAARRRPVFDSSA